MTNFKIVAPLSADKGYRFAVDEFVQLCEKITGYSPEIIEDDDGASNLVIIGSDAVNKVSEKLLLSRKIRNFSFRFASDDFDIRTESVDGRKMLFLSGGRVRSTIYAVYTYFERVCGCRWFWDGDRVPTLDALPLDGIDISERPRFEYRGIRYFAHRALHRFQAEHWNLEDWKREINWILKKKLNLFMLRIGTDDLFQRAFPEHTDYPSENGIAVPGKCGYNERTSAWSLKYRGMLREAVLKYAFERDLMHPEDCGTITHWYSPTPRDFIENVHPKVFGQSDGQYAGAAETMVWDIREQNNFDMYMHMTDTHVKEFGRPELFHTIGFAERRFSEVHEENMRMKEHVYNKTCEHIERSYPGSKMLIASWDMWFTYKPEEAERLVSRLNPSNTVFFDYTSDNTTNNNFRNWGLYKEFPYVIGIFHAFSRDAEIRGNYTATDKCIADATADSQCKGLIFWPELSHSDTFMLEYFTSNAWLPEEVDLNCRLERYCQDRYGERAERYIGIWKRFMPIAQLMSWCMDDRDKDNPQEYWVQPERALNMYDDGKDIIKNFDLAALERLRGDAAEILHSLADADTIGDMEQRDKLDIARTIIGRYIHGAMLYALTETTPAEVERAKSDVLNLTEQMYRLLSTDDEYSMLKTCEKMAEVQPVNPAFYDTIKENASCNYHRSCYTEQIRSLYIPELLVLFNWIERGKGSSAEYHEQMKLCHKKYLDTPLTDLAKFEKYDIKKVLNDAAQIISDGGKK